MTTSVSQVGNALEQYAIKDKSSSKSKTLGQDTFLELMTAQLKNQDPMKPMDSSNFLGQIAQFSTVNGINDLVKSFSALSTSLQSNQALQASTLVGRTVLVESKTAPLTAGGTYNGAVDLKQSTGALNLDIKDAAGQVVKRLSLGAQASGLVPFQWDGLDDAGAAVPPGRYTVTAQAAIDGKEVNMPTLLRAHVDSVTLVPNGGSPKLNLNQMGSINLDRVREVM